MATKINDHLINTLKAFGVTIADQVDLNDAAKMRISLKHAVGQQLQKDSQDQNLQANELAYAFNAAKLVLLDNHIFDGLTVKTKKGKVLTTQELCDLTLNRLCFDFDNTTDTLLSGVIAGVPERENITPDQAEQVAAVLGDVVLDGYQDFLQQHPDLNANTFSPTDYKEVKNQLKISQILVELLGDENKARQILNQPVTADSPAWHNTALSGDYRAASAARQARGNMGAVSGVTNDGQVRVLDLLMSLSQSVTKAQVLAFCEHRAIEQDAVNEQRPAKDDPARLVNVLGHEGRKTVEQTIDAHLSNKLIPATKAPQGAPLPDHAWRGYSRLATLIKETVRLMYGSVQQGGFVERLLSRRIAPLAESRPEPRWQIAEYATMPENYRDAKTGQLNAAGEFFERVQARLMADKVKIAEYEVLVQADPHDKDAVAKFNYYNYRIQVAGEALAKVARDTNMDAELLHDQEYYQTLDRQIVLLDSSNYPQAKELMAKETVFAVAEQDWQRPTEGYWVDALQTFKQHNDQAPDTAANDASYRMLAEMFSLGDRYEQDITKEDLVNLLQNVPNGPFNPKKVDQFIKGLTAAAGSQDALTATDCRQGLHDAATNFLTKVKYQDAYANHQLIDSYNPER